MDSFFLKELVENLAFVTKVKHVLISRAENEEASDFIDTAAFWSNDKFVENVRYALHGTPCKEVLDGNTRFYSHGIQALFPEDEVLKSMNAEGYLGCPILSSSDQILGHISIIDTKPLENEQELITIVQAFASLASSEIERNQTELRDRSTRRKEQDLREAELIILEMIAQNKPKKEILTQLCLAMEKQASSKAFASVLLVNKGTSCLQLGAAPSFNAQVQEALDGLTIDECSGSCAAAVFRKTPVFVTDVQTDPLWAELRQFAKDQHIEACWSMPFLSETGDVLGSFALTHTIIAEPTESDIRLMKVAAHLAGITVERFKAYRALISSEEKFSRALEISPDGVVITRVADGKIIEANDACIKMTGYSRNELIGKTTLELNIYSPEERERVVSLLKEAGSYSGFESTLRRKDGKVLKTLSSGVIFENNGESCIFAIVHDDTQRKQAQRALTESEERFRSAFGKAPIVVTLVDRNGIVLQSNEKAIGLLGYSEEEIVGKSIGEFTHPDDLERSMNMYQLLVSGELDHYEIEKRYIGKSGNIVWAQLNISSVKDAEDNFSYAIAHNLD
ncbi:MAG: PAS domain S-box protein, partial [Gammaproteobacteria bacterium]|nr:PAS domain S-box protein [Gammaproteobacteria bacterium]